LCIATYGGSSPAAVRLWQCTKKLFTANAAVTDISSLATMKTRDGTFKK
jgi:hypothetical protein